MLSSLFGYVRYALVVHLLFFCGVLCQLSASAATLHSAELYFYVEEEGEPQQLSEQAMVEAEERYVLARTLLEHKSVTDVSAVPNLLQLSAKAGFIPAQLLLLDMWEGKFKGIEADLEKAQSHALIMAGEVLPENASQEQREAQIVAMLRLVRYLEYSSHDLEARQEAFQWLKRAADLRSHEAQAELARYYMMGIGCKKEPLVAIKLLKQLSHDAPETKHLFFYLGYICQSGLGLSKPNYPLAVKYYARGVEHDDARAMNNLAILYERGIGVKKNEQQALLYFREAASLGDKSAAVNMQRLLHRLGSGEEEEDYLSYTQRLAHAIERVAQYIPFLHE